MLPDDMERLRSYIMMSDYLQCCADSSCDKSFQGKIFLIYLPKTEPLQPRPLDAIRSRRQVRMLASQAIQQVELPQNLPL